MSSKKTSRLFFIVFFILISVLFCYFRLKPIYYQTVGYTYDQGRDFLKAAQMVEEKRPTFIGPTTGIQGIFHGSWYYYILLIPFLLFKGSPIGFYFFNFLLQFASFILFIYFLKKYFDNLTSLIVGSLIAISPYFIFTSIFVGNNIMAIPTFLLLLISIYYLCLKNGQGSNKKINIIIIGLLLGFVFEFEFPFGLFLAPSFFFSVIFYKPLRAIYFQLEHLKYFLVALTIPFLPRLLFEVKNNFLQTKTFINFIFQPHLYNPKTYVDVFKDRLNLFFGYYKSIFAQNIFAWLILILICITTVVLIKKKQQIKQFGLAFYLILLSFLFFFSTLYKDNFWGNYYEGIQYLLLFIIALLLSKVLIKNKFFQSIKFILIIVIVALGIRSFLYDVGKKPADSLLKSQINIVNYILEKEKYSSSYCVKIYTPPVIPYTYDYLFLYSKLSKHSLIPEKDWIRQQCWAIIEPDDYKERQANWIKDNIPRVAHKVSEKNINGTLIRLYEKE